MIVAEIGVNWNGDRSRIPAFIDAAKSAGATAAKFQAYNTDKLVARRGITDPKTIDLLRRNELTDADLALIEECARKVDIKHFYSVFDPSQVERVLSRGACALKIAEKESADGLLVDACEDKCGLVYVSLHQNTTDPRLWQRRPVACVPQYPATIPPHLRVIHPRGFCGLSSHWQDYRIPAAAALRGAEYIEFHVRLSDDDPEAAWSLSIEDATKCCKLIREYESWL